MERSRNRDSDRSRDRDDDRERDSGRRSSRESGGRGSSYHYEGRSREDVTKRSTQGANEFDKFLIEAVKMFKPNDKDNNIRILPPTWPKPKHYGLDIHVHYGVGPDKQSYLCLHKMKGEACPICEDRQLALEDGDEKYAKELEAKRRVLVYLIDRDAAKEGLQAWSMPWTVDRDICAISVDKRSGEVLPIDHPDEGYDVSFEKKGAKERTEYLGMQIARRASSLGNDDWLDQAVDLPLTETLVYFSYNHIAKAFGGGRATKSRDHDPSTDPDDRSSDRTTTRPTASEKKEYTWAEVHELVGEGLDRLVESENLPLKPARFDSDEELADAICEELGIEKPSTRRKVVDEDRPQDGRSRLESMRARRTAGD
jgi:gp32 DNA binding protein like